MFSCFLLIDVIILLLFSGKDVVSSELHGWTLSSSLLLAGLPAILYATQVRASSCSFLELNKSNISESYMYIISIIIQGVLTYLGYQNTDSVTFNGLNQTKT